jgi:ribose transport system substrate-binding protein
MGHFIVNVTSLESYNRGLKEAWAQLGQAFVEQSYDGDTQKAISQAELFGGLGVKMASSYLSGDAAYTPYVQALAKQGIYYVNLANSIPWRYPLEPKFRGHHLMHIQASFADESYLVAKTLFQAVGGEGELIHLQGVVGDASDTQRSAGFFRALKEYPKIKVVASQATNWDRVKAQAATEALVPAHPKVRMIFAQNDSIGSGAVAALRSLRKKDVKVVGVDGDPDFLKMIVDGDYAIATSATRLDHVGFIAAARLFDQLHGAGNLWDPIESMLRVDDVFIDTPAAAQALLNLTPANKPLPYNAKLISRHLHPKDWKVPGLVQIMDPYFEWGPGGPNPHKQPAGLVIPPAYKRSLTAAHAEALNRRYASRAVDVYASVRAKAKYKGHVLGTLKKLGIPGYRPYTAPKGYR